MVDYDVELKEYDSIPEGLLDAEPHELFDLLGGPAIIRIKGRKSPPLFVSTLLHGNEHTSFLAMRRLLKSYIGKGRSLPRHLVLFIGNVEAAAQGRRHLDHQPDFNRIWLNIDRKYRFVDAVKKIVMKDSLFASIDIHNNTGKNPHYACVSTLENEHLYLAEFFGRTAVFFSSPIEALSVVMSQIVPSVTLECGLSGEERGTQHAYDYVDAMLHLDHFPGRHVSPQDLDLYETVVRIICDKDIKIAFASDINKSEADLVLRDDIDDLNFQEMEKGIELGSYNGSYLDKIRVVDAAGNDCTEEYIKLVDGKIIFSKMVIPSMFTADTRVIVQDCLGYLMVHKNW